MNSNVLQGKGNSIELENLHGAITKVYVGGVLDILDKIDTSDVARKTYLQEIVDSATPDEVEKPREYVLSKEALALLKQAQGFLKENGVEMDLVQSSNMRQVRGNLAKQLADKRAELERT